MGAGIIGQASLAYALPNILLHHPDVLARMQNEVDTATGKSGQCLYSVFLVLITQPNRQILMMPRAEYYMAGFVHGRIVIGSFLHAH
jgi:hypothetical protein